MYLIFLLLKRKIVKISIFFLHSKTFEFPSQDVNQQFHNPYPLPVIDAIVRIMESD